MMDTTNGGTLEQLKFTSRPCSHDKSECFISIVRGYIIHRAMQCDGHDKRWYTGTAQVH